MSDKLIHGSQLEDNTINAGQKLEDGSVTSDKMGTGSVTADKIVNNAVTDSKISGVSGSKLTDSTVTEAKLAAALASKINNPTISGIGVGDAFELFAVTDGIKYSQSTSDLYKQTTPASNFWHPSYSLASFSNGVQTIGYNDAGNSTILTAPTNKQFYFGTDLALGSGSKAANNAYGMYFSFEAAFKGIIWVGGNEVFNNLEASDNASSYTTKQGHQIVTVAGAQAYLNIGGSTRIAILYKQTSGQSSLVFGVRFGTVVGGTELVGPESFAFSLDMDTVGQGTDFIKLSAAEYATIANIPSAAETAFLTALKANDASQGGVVFGDDLSSYPTSAALAASSGAALIGFDDSGLGFSASDVQEALEQVLISVATTLTFDNTVPNLPGLGSNPSIQNGINKLAYAANLHIDSTYWSSILTPSTYYVQNALDALRNCDNINFSNISAGIGTNPATVQDLGDALANPNNVPFSHTSVTATNVGDAIDELSDRFNSATNVGYSGVAVGLTATNVKDAIDEIALATSVSNDLYTYGGGVAFTTVRTQFGNLSVTLPTDLNTVGISMQNGMDYAYDAITNFKIAEDSKNASQDLAIAAHSATGDYFTAGSVSNDYAIPSQSDWGEVDILLKDGASWSKMEAAYDDSTGKMIVSYRTASSCDVSNDLTVAAISLGGGGVSLSVISDNLRVTGTLAAGQKATTRVRFD